MATAEPNSRWKFVSDYSIWCENSKHYDAAVCHAVKAANNKSIARGAYYGETHWPNWEACGGDGCALLSSNPKETFYSICSLGRLATYYVDIRIASRISATLHFAQAHYIRISIKNTGHDFFGRSTVPNPLAIWTHNLNHLDFYKNFSASNCPSANGPNVGEIGARVTAGNAYSLFNSHGMDVAGGYEASVGVAGGYGQGDGVGDYTTTYGLMVDNASEFEVVTAGGQVRILNECNDPDLFWAMRGGGGGTYAVLTKYRVQVFPSLPIHTYNYAAKFIGSSSSQQQALRAILIAHARNQIGWSSKLVTGGGNYYPDGVSLNFVNFYDDDGSKLKNATPSFIQMVSSFENITVTQNDYNSYATYNDYLVASAGPDAVATEPAGIFSLLASRLMPRSLFTTSESLESLVSCVISGIEKSRTFLERTAAQVVFETPVSNPDTNHKTSALPAWRDALWHVILVGEWEEPLAPSVQEQATDGFLEMLEPLKELTPGGGAYLNEAHYGEPDWEDTLFGENYGRLLEIKNSYDLTHVFDCWKCVGWRGE